MSPTFRAGVGIVVLDARGRALALERSAVRGGWQLPQGGIEGDEEPVDALWRELREETGLTADDVHVVAELPEWLGYELPAEYRSPKTGLGQVHKWFLLRTQGDDPPVRTGTMPGAEFRAWRWVDLAELAEQTVAFRRPVYRRLVALVASVDGLG
jgi:putative (di)nucleoside polyphosphate hydrolase